MTVYVAAKTRASDNYLRFGAQWVYREDAMGFKIASVPQEDADYLIGRLMSGLDLFCARQPQPTLEDAIVEATRWGIFLP